MLPAAGPRAAHVRWLWALALYSSQRVAAVQAAVCCRISKRTDDPVGHTVGKLDMHMHITNAGCFIRVCFCKPLSCAPQVLSWLESKAMHKNLSRTSHLKRMHITSSLADSVEFHNVLLGFCLTRGVESFMLGLVVNTRIAVLLDLDKTLVFSRFVLDLECDVKKSEAKRCVPIYVTRISTRAHTLAFVVQHVSWFQQRVCLH